MTVESKQEIIDYLKSLRIEETVTIEQIVRHLGQIKGEPFTVFEVQHYETIEKYLIEEGLIIDTYRTTKLYCIDSKVKSL